MGDQGEWTRWGEAAATVLARRLCERRAERLGLDAGGSWDRLTEREREECLAEARETIGMLPEPPSLRSYQGRARTWFEPIVEDDPTDRVERRSRFGEEALELQQSLGQTAEEAHALVEYVYGRPVGEPAAEAGGALATLALLCDFEGFDMLECGELELERISRPEKVAAVMRKRAARGGRGALPGIADPDFLPTTPV